MPLVNRSFSQLIDFTRTSAATFVNSSGNIASTPQSRNLLTFTQEFDNAVWVKTNTTITANSAAAPDGTMTADTLTAGAGAGSGQQIYQALTTIGAGSFVYSIYAKQGSGETDSNRFVVFNQTASLTFASITVNYSSGVVTQTVGTGATMTAVGNGWWRVVIPFTSTATLGNSIRFFVGSSGSVETPGEFIYAWGAQVESGSSATDYTRNFGGLFPPRFDYDPVTLAPRGLLIEEQRTNLVVRSEEFDAGNWTKSRTTATANATTSPDGTVDADKLVENTDNGTHRVFQQAAKAASTLTRTFSVYLKAAERTRARIQMSNNNESVSTSADVNLSAGTITNASNSGDPSVVAVGSSITNAGNGWYRCTITATYDATVTNPGAFVFIHDGAGSNSYTGDGTSGLFIWGAQWEDGAFATSYIPTVASQVTRSADVAAINAPNFASWFNAAEGTLVSQFSSFATVTPTRTVAELNDGTTNNRYLQGNNPGGSARFLTFNGGVAVVTTLDYTAPAVGAVAKWATAYRAGDYGASLNGAAALTSTYGSVLSGINALTLGSIAGGGQSLNGHLRSIRYYPTRLTNAQLQALTA